MRYPQPTYKKLLIKRSPISRFPFLKRSCITRTKATTSPWDILRYLDAASVEERPRISWRIWLWRSRMASCITFRLEGTASWDQDIAGAAYYMVFGGFVRFLKATCIFQWLLSAFCRNAGLFFCKFCLTRLKICFQVAKVYKKLLPEFWPPLGTSLPSPGPAAWKRSALPCNKRED